eukprot:121496-Rhodomonas_salina.1
MAQDWPVAVSHVTDAPPCGRIPLRSSRESEGVKKERRRRPGQSTPSKRGSELDCPQMKRRRQGPAQRSGNLKPGGRAECLFASSPPTTGGSLAGAEAAAQGLRVQGHARGVEVLAVLA